MAFTAKYVGPKSYIEFSTRFRPSFKTEMKRSVQMNIGSGTIDGEETFSRKIYFSQFFSQKETNAMHSCVKLGTTSTKYESLMECRRY